MNWQTPVTVALGLAAAVYLLRRWWPTWRGLWQRQTAAQAGACGTPTTGSLWLGLRQLREQQGHGQQRPPRAHRASRTSLTPLATGRMSAGPGVCHPLQTRGHAPLCRGW